MGKMKAQGRPEYGYWYYPPQSERAPAGNRLDIILFENPTGQHFDPQYVSLPVKTDRVIETVHFHHPWGFADTYPVCAGLVEMVDWGDKKEEAFTFGGRFSLSVHEGWTRGTLESTAPIFAVSEADPVKRLWIDEVEILLAERRAAFAEDPREFERRLAEVEPFALYIACLNALIQKFEPLQHLQEPQILQLLHFLQTEKRRLAEEGLLPLALSVLEDVL